MITELAAVRKHTEPSPGLSTCEHRTVAKDGRIICARVVRGEAEVSPNTCRTCPFKAIDCAHLRFSLEQTEPRRLVVRYNGKTEVWDDDPPEVRFERAACAARVMPIHHPKQCAGCTQRQALQPAETPASRRRRAAAGNEPGRVASGKVVPFPPREVAAAAATG